MAVSTPVCDFDRKAPDFALPDPSGQLHDLGGLRGPRGLLVMFICNHCPYVKAVIDRVVEDAKELQSRGFGVVAICSNDAVEYPADAPEKMAEFAAEHGFTFPYLVDETQDVARAFDAQCTPDFFGFNAMLGLQYRGRLDESGKDAGPEGARRELLEAMKQIALTGKGPMDQVPSMGCGIKWKV